MSYCASRYHTVRRHTHPVNVGGIGIGGSNPLRIQSMTTSDTQDVAATVQQSIALAEVGCEIVRITAPNVAAAKCLRAIRSQFSAAGFAHIPLVADIHFLPSAAMEAVEHVEKIRINPGNYADKKKFAVREYSDGDYDTELARLHETFSPLVLRCQALGRAMRIGTNHGSLSDRIMNRYGDSPLGMVESALEFGRVRRTSRFDVVQPLDAFLERARQEWPERRPGAAEVIRLAARDLKQRRFRIPDTFPAGLYTQLSALGLQLELAQGALFPEREIKTPAEIAALREGNRCSAIGLAAAEGILRASKVRGRRLYHRGKVVTSESIKLAIEVAVLEAGAVSAHTIVAGGDQACDPHERGHGPLRPNELIIVDIFPRVTRHGYHGDMTRTFLRGRATERQQALVHAVREAQRAALRRLRAGVNGRDVHQECVNVFARAGFATRHLKSGSVGFFHGTGHGLGYDIHEDPALSIRNPLPLVAGHAVTVEPGLYYPGIGGCRFEDCVVVTKKGCDFLSSHPYHWEIA